MTASQHDVFLSHVEEDREVVERVARMLEAAGCRTWFYERDSLPGFSYLLTTRTAIDESRCCLLFASRATANRSHQVDKEVIHAHESGKRIIPVLIDIRFSDFRRSHPEWHQAIGAVVGVEMSTSDIAPAVDRLLVGLRALGLGGRSVPREESAVPESDFSAVGRDDDEDGPAVAEESSTAITPDAADSAETGRSSLVQPAVVVHEHSASGLLADVIVTDTEHRAAAAIDIVLRHARLGPMPRHVSIHPSAPTAPAPARSPVEYYRITGLAEHVPVLVRVYWLERLPPWSMFRRTFGVVSIPVVGTMTAAASMLTSDAAGILAKGEFVSIVGPGRPLPCFIRRRLRTTRRNQKAIVVTPAVRRADGRVESFAPLKVTVPPAPAGVAWLEFGFRVDQDGRYTLSACDPLDAMAVRDLVVVQ